MNRSEEENRIIADTLNTIANEWTVEAKRENEKYHYSFDIDKDIKKGKISFVIGRKGTGKTSISERIYNTSKGEELSKRISFHNFPFNDIYSLNDNNYPSPRQYISIWKYLIYNYVCELMSLNESLDSSVTINLKKLYKDSIDSNDALGELIPKWTATGFGGEILGNGFNISGEVNVKEISWISKKNLFEKLIKQYAGNFTYFILIDELDEDYHKFSSDEQKEQYLQLLTSLFKAVQDIRSIFDTTQTRIYPVVFLRDDIYSQILDSDKNKWSEFSSELRWTKYELFEMMCYRMFIANNKKNYRDEIWGKIFVDDEKKNNSNNRNECFDYITKCTQLRPRDYIEYIKKCANYAIKRGESKITFQTIKDVESQYSDYLYQEIIDETHVEIPNIEKILSIFSNMRKKQFDADEFIAHYNDIIEYDEETAKNILKKLFTFGVIGNQPLGEKYPTFKYVNKRLELNCNEPIILHRGLYKALQV